MYRLGDKYVNRIKSSTKVDPVLLTFQIKDRMPQFIYLSWALQLIDT